MMQQIYNSNTARPFPLQEGSKVPWDIIVDMSITVPEGVDPVITAVSVSRNLFFASVEDSATRSAVGFFSAPYPAPFSVYRMTSFDGRSSGWIVPGPGISEDMLLSSLDEKPDPSVVIREYNDPDAVDSVFINGIQHSVNGLLGIAPLTGALRVSLGVRTIEGAGDKNCIILERNDSELTTDAIYGGFAELGGYPGAVFSIAGARPDNNGNVEIETAPSSFTVTPVKISTEEVIGLLLAEYTELCAVYNPVPKVLHGRCEQGISRDLPCDTLITQGHTDPPLPPRNPEYVNDNCGCDD